MIFFSVLFVLLRAYRVLQSSGLTAIRIMCVAKLNTTLADPCLLALLAYGILMQPHCEY